MKQLNSGRLAVACLVVLACSQVFANTIAVTNTNDSGPGSLRDAIASAASGDTINFNLTFPATITLSSTLTISTNLTISGPGASNLAISGGGAVRVFSNGSCLSSPPPCSGATVTISGVTIENGRGDHGGGGVFNSGTLTVSNSTLTGNSATNANGGGAIYNDLGALTVTNSTVSGNSATAISGASASGGGIFTYHGTLTVNNSTLTGNSTSAPAGDFGGGISSFGSSVTVTNSIVTANSASYGGGIDNMIGTLTLTNSTISANSALYGGGVFNSGDGTAVVTNSTISGNSASYGGGISNGNSTLTVKSMIVANTSSGGNCYLAPQGSLTSAGHNLSDDATCAFSGTGDINSTPAGLDPTGLQYNGGPTQTIALLTTSAAVDAIPVSPVNYCTAVDGGTPIATDQRGVTRPHGSACDIGAFEFAPVVVLCDTSDGAWHATDVAIACTASAKLGLANPTDASFSLSTSVPNATETANAQTNSHQVCDQAGTCVMAGPIFGNKVDKKAASLNCAGPDGLWHATDASLACNASDNGSGLANPADASFLLSTSVSGNTETSNASTGSHGVCDAVNNCATAGPIGGNKVDKKPPNIAISAPTNGDYVIGQLASSSYSCADGGSGLASCAGPVPSGSNFDTASVGTKNFTVNAADNVANAASQTVSYRVGHNVCFLYDTSKAVNSGRTVPIKIQLCDFNGNDLSSSGIVVHAVQVQQVSTNISGLLETPGSANPDNDFRYDPTLGPSGGYIFNLGTTGLGTGSYQLQFTAGVDPILHAAGFQVK